MYAYVHICKYIYTCLCVFECSLDKVGDCANFRTDCVTYTVSFE